MAAHQCRVSGLVDAQDRCHAALGETAPLDNLSDFDREIGLDIEFFRIGESQITNYVSAADLNRACPFRTSSKLSALIIRCRCKSCFPACP